MVEEVGNREYRLPTGANSCMTDDKTKSELGEFLWVNIGKFSLGLLALVGIAVAAFIGVFWHSTLSGNPTDWGVFGDYFGGVIGTIVGLATWALLVATVALQRKMIDVAQDQLSISRQELRVANLEMAQANILVRQQSFEATFFRMLELVREFGKSTHIYTRVAGGTVHTRQVETASHVAGICMGEVAEIDGAGDALTEAIAGAGSQMRDDEDMRDWIDRFCGATYHTLKLIHFSQLPEDQRARYASLLRSQFSSSQLICVFFSLASRQSNDLSHFVNYYGMLKHLPSIGGHDSFNPPAYGSLHPSAFLGYADRKTLGIVPHASISLPA